MHSIGTGDVDDAAAAAAFDVGKNEIGDVEVMPPPTAPELMAIAMLMMTLLLLLQMTAN